MVISELLHGATEIENKLKIKYYLDSRTATKLVREWIDLYVSELEEDGKLAKASRPVEKISPLK